MTRNANPAFAAITARTAAALASAAVTLSIFCSVAFGMTALSDANCLVASQAAATHQA